MKKPLILAAAALVLAGAGCIQITGTGNSQNDGGLWKSADSGAHWSQKSAIAAVGAARSFGAANVTAVSFDPSDPKAVYAGTEANGLLYTYDGAESWSSAAGLGQIRISAVAVSPAEKCTIFIATGNRIGRSRDCSRTWENAYVDTRASVRITDLVIDFFNPAVVWASTSAGDLLKSGDNGASWSVANRFDSEIRQVLMSAADSRVIWVSTSGKGLWRTADGAAAWTDLSPKFGAFSGALDSIILAEDRATTGAMLTASNYGLLRSVNGGDTWQSIPLLTPPGSTVIYSLAVNPKNSREIWYGTANTLYHSVDGGAKWTTSRLPTSRAATDLVADPAGGTLYMGTTLLQKKSGF